MRQDLAWQAVLGLLLLLLLLSTGSCHTPAPEAVAPEKPRPRAEADTSMTQETEPSIEPDHGYEKAMALWQEKKKEIEGLEPPPRPIHNPKETKGLLRLPDGTYVPNLNGVETALKLQLTDQELTPIIGIQRARDGVDWYLHASGRMTTTSHFMGMVEGKEVKRCTVSTAVPIRDSRE